jgi:hypothetical protein
MRCIKKIQSETLKGRVHLEGVYGMIILKWILKILSEGEELSCIVRDGGFVECLSDYQLLKEACAPGS